MHTLHKGIADSAYFYTELYYHCVAVILTWHYSVEIFCFIHAKHQGFPHFAERGEVSFFVPIVALGEPLLGRHLLLGGSGRELWGNKQPRICYCNCVTAHDTRRTNWVECAHECNRLLIDRGGPHSQPIRTLILCIDLFTSGLSEIPKPCFNL